MGIFGSGTIAYATLQSTNKEASSLMAEGLVEHGTVILAHEQTDGRGQRGSTWISEPGKDLTFSIVLKPEHLRADGQFRLIEVAALAVQEALAAWLPISPAIKWPNDVLVGRRKVAGILIRSEVVGDVVMGAVAGIGVNVNSTNLPEDMLATSLSIETGRTFDRTDVLNKVLEVFARYWSLSAEEIDAAYRARLWGVGRWCPMVLDGEPVELRPLEVDGTGRLLAERWDGTVAAYGTDRLRYAAR